MLQFRYKFLQNMPNADYQYEVDPDNTYYINDFLNFDLIWNTGIGFGLLSWDNSIFYNIITKKWNNMVC